MKKLFTLAALSLLSAVLVHPSSAAPTAKAGAKCTKVNSTQTVGTKKFTCVKSGSRLIWNKGAAVKAPTAANPAPKLELFAPVPVDYIFAKIENDLEINYWSPINWGGLVADEQAVMRFPVTLKSNVDANIVRVLVQHSEGVQHIVVSGRWDWENVKAGDSKTLDLTISLGAIKGQREQGYTGGYTFKVFLNYKDKTKGEKSFQVPIDFVLPTVSKVEIDQPTKVEASANPALVKYKNCTEAKAAGVAPLNRSLNPALYELNSGLDRDKDGIACES
jgi:hypothetical protein